MTSRTFLGFLKSDRRAIHKWCPQIYLDLFKTLCPLVCIWGWYAVWNPWGHQTSGLGLTTSHGLRETEQKNCVKLPALGETNINFSPKFTQPMGSNKSQPIIYEWPLTAVSSEAWAKLRDWASVAVRGPAATLRQHCPCLSRNHCRSQAFFNDQEMMFLRCNGTILRVAQYRGGGEEA